MLTFEQVDELIKKIAERPTEWDEKIFRKHGLRFEIERKPESELISVRVKHLERGYADRVMIRADSQHLGARINSAKDAFVTRFETLRGLGMA